MINAAQVRAARGLLDLSQAELSRLAEVSIGTIKKFESSAGEPRVTVQILLRIQRALENAGIIFIDEDGQAGPGVRLRRSLP
jgi:transcriptional regulator with XRE-family HTH domain